MAATDYKFEGWLGKNKEAAQGKMEWGTYEPKTWTEDDVDIKIAYCGICGSDIHTLRSGWAATLYPCCVGHEGVGTVVKVGKNVKHLALGDRAGIGAQSDSCGKCDECKAGKESYCAGGIVGTYNGKYADGSKSYGGYSNYGRYPAHFVVKIPDALPLAEAAPMLCGGVTVYSPLKRGGAGPGKKVGIVGVGGLGHFGVMFAAALGADEVVAISRSSTKKADALKMGATKFIATSEDPNWAQEHSRSLDLIISTVSDANMPLNKYFALLKTDGEFIQVGAPEDVFPPLSAFQFIAKGIKLSGSAIGSPGQIKEMLDFAVEKKVKSWIEVVDLKDANKAIVDMQDGKGRYRYVLRNGKHADELEK